MAQFIIVTGPGGLKHRLNVGHIVFYVEKPHTGVSLYLATGTTIDIAGSAEALDQLIRNTDRSAVLSQDR